MLTVKNTMERMNLYSEDEIDILMIKGAVLLNGKYCYTDQSVMPSDLLQYVKIPVMEYIPITEEMEPDFLKRWRLNWRQFEAIDKLAKKRGELLYRYIAEPIADGRAIYQILRVNKKSVRVRVCEGIGDDWVLPYWGEEATIPLEYAEKSIRGRDALRAMFAQKPQAPNINND